MRPINKFCLLRNSPTLRQAILLRLKHTTQREVCEKTGLYPPKLNNYLKGEAKAITQVALLNVCKELNIEVELKITLK